MIDMNPSDISCVYSTLTFVCAQAKRYNVTPVVTFDQPLWWKALTVIQNDHKDSSLKSVVLRLGGLHTQMSFLGCIGHLMAESGLKELLELVYANNTVIHMLTGKAIARSVRGHLLVDAALNTMLVADAYNLPLPLQTSDTDEIAEEADDSGMTEEGFEEGQPPGNALIKEACKLYHQLMDESTSTVEVCQSEALRKIADDIEIYVSSLGNLRTARLWIQYMDMIDILRRFIKAERTGDWELHLQAVHDMLPNFTGSGHNLYAKSARLYLQMMEQLEDLHPEVYTSFKNGLHVIRRTERYWAGLSTDLVIEQVLIMRSVKTSGGLTRGRGMTETQRSVWLLSRPACAEVNYCMQEFAGTSYKTSEQHKDLGKARQKRDVKDTIEILGFLAERSPFDSDPSLRSIASGVIAD